MDKRIAKKADQKELARFMRLVSKGKSITPVIMILPPLKGQRKLRILELK
ncbi:MAG: hypothetical protein UW30_C0013G0001 [Candidatus Giovannonibacteria bacterium GW2011_GWA2_44_13b]|uniref:Uncharacterized protein n=1 Tax=Candidatus Giovannonibacteria bacterium GW2011_GWA2_44_13b TaxID=1618647 RepID=A0A0G1JAK7_9BACT|nr:MAG: hypothetical protein UW30_C0013G0001 [Candidatus Giovannonibacteria bacterium GW2011_GWA2_44_13b]